HNFLEQSKANESNYKPENLITKSELATQGEKCSFMGSSLGKKKPVPQSIVSIDAFNKTHQATKEALLHNLNHQITTKPAKIETTPHLKNYKLHKLPPEIFIHIFEFFPISFLLSNISVVCKEWYSYVWNSHTLWHTLELNLMEPIMFEPFKSFCKLHTKKLKSVKRLIYTSDKVTFVSIHGILDYFNCSSLNYIQWNYWNDSNMDRLSSFTNLTELGFRYCNLQNLDG